MATTKTKSESMKNKSKMWGGDKATSGTKSAKASKSTTTKSAISKSATTKSKGSKDEPTHNKTAPTVKGGKTMNKTEFAQDMTALNDVEIISDVLNTHKGLVKLYGTALCEASCENMRQLVGRHLTECGDDQFDVFLYMNERNLYPTEDATTQKLTKAKDKFKQYEQQMKK